MVYTYSSSLKEAQNGPRFNYRGIAENPLEVWRPQFPAQCAILYGTLLSFNHQSSSKLAGCNPNGECI